MYGELHIWIPRGDYSIRPSLEVNSPFFVSRLLRLTLASHTGSELPKGQAIFDVTRKILIGLE